MLKGRFSNYDFKSLSTRKIGDTQETMEQKRWQILSKRTSYNEMYHWVTTRMQYNEGREQNSKGYMRGTRAKQAIPAWSRIPLANSVCLTFPKPQAVSVLQPMMYTI